MNTIVLGIDTSTAVSVGLARGSEVLVSLHYDDPRAHAEQLMPLIHRGCEEAGIALTDIAEVAIGVGPGPYTGLRVGVATGRVLAHLAGLTPHPVCSLDILARQWAGVDGEFVVVLTLVAMSCIGLATTLPGIVSTAPMSLALRTCRRICPSVVRDVWFAV